MSRFFRRLLRWALWVGAFGRLAAQPGYPPVVVGEGPDFDLAGRVHYLTDWGEMTPRQALQRLQTGGFAVSQRRVIDLGYGAPNCWVYLRIQNATARRRHLIFSISHENINLLRQYRVVGSGAERLVSTGDHLPVTTRPLDHRHYAFPLLLEPGETQAYLFFANKRRDFLFIPMQLTERARFEAQERLNYALHGGFSGVLLFVVVFSAALWLRFREALYGTFSLYVLCVGLSMLASSGLGLEYVWGHWPRFNDHTRSWFTLLWEALLLRFTRQLLGASAPRPTLLALRGAEWGHYLLLLPFVGFYALNTLPDGGTMRALSACIETFRYGSLVLLVYACLQGVRRGNAASGYFLGATSFFLFITLLSGLGRLGVLALPVFFGPVNLGAVAFVVEIALLSFGLIIRYYALHQQRNRLEQELAHSRQEARERVIQAEEDERRRIARDLHDDLGNLLAAIRFALERVPDPPPGVDEARRMLMQATRNVRAISHNLMPSEFERFGLAGVLSESVRKLDGLHGTRFQLVQAGTPQRLELSRELVVFRMISELLTNVVRHAQAQSAFVQLVYRPDCLCVMVEDDGRGLAAEPPATGGGIGLQNVSSRAQYLGARLVAESRVGQGTTVVIEVPYNPMPAPDGPTPQ